MLEIAKSPESVISKDDYYIRDFVIKDDKDKIVATICETTLYVGKKTRGHVDKHNETYFFTGGRGVMMIDKDFVEVGLEQTEIVFVEKGQWHRVMNTHPLVPLKFISVVPGEVNRVPYPAPGHRLD